MMRKVPYILFTIPVAIIIGFLILSDIDKNIKQDLQNQVDSLNKRLQSQIEINGQLVKANSDLEETIEAQALVIESREQEVVRANKATNEIRKKYESIKPMRFSNNAQRDSILSVLYPAR